MYVYNLGFSNGGPEEQIALVHLLLHTYEKEKKWLDCRPHANFVIMNVSAAACGLVFEEFTENKTAYKVAG